MIKNRRNLLDKSSSELNYQARSLVLSAYDTALMAADPHRIIAAQVRYCGSFLQVHDQNFAMNHYRRIFVIGAGKASGAMADALEKILGDRLTSGVINVPAITSDPEVSDSSMRTLQIKDAGVSHSGRIRFNFAGHPVPDAAGVAGAAEILAVAESAGADDLLICLISGGGSSLLPLPRGAVSLQDKQMLTSQLLRSGAAISEINTVRKHISAIKGGWLAKMAWPATVINLVLSDVPGDPLDFIASGPAVPDSTTFADAVAVLQRYSLFAAAPLSVRQLLIDGKNRLIPETPKADDLVFAKVFNHVIGNNHTARSAIADSLRLAGLQVKTLEIPFTGGVSEAVSALAEEITELVYQRPLHGPMALVAGGETTLHVTGDGVGGRNQEMALAMVSRLAGYENVLFAALSTDGIDGPTDAAGAMVDGSSQARSIALGRHAEDFLRRNDSWHFFKELGDLVCTGYTGTNVNDLYVAVVL